MLANAPMRRDESKAPGATEKCENDPQESALLDIIFFAHVRLDITF